MSVDLSRTILPILLSLFVCMSACAPARPSVRPGTIPQVRAVTPEEEQYGQTILEALSEKYPLEYNHPGLERVQKIVDRLTKAANADKEPWHVYLLRSDDVKNAAATRGNHVFVWTGMVNSVQSDDELAVVIAHEIAHVLAGHTDPDPNEELRKILIGVGAVAAGIAVTAATQNTYIAADLGDITAALTQQLGEGVLTNPFSKSMELEADIIGLMLMAEAKFDPKAAPDFWSKAQGNPDFHSGLEFFSTHPPTRERLANVNKYLPIAIERYEGRAPSAPPLTVDNGYGVAELRNGDSFDLSAAPPSDITKSDTRPPEGVDAREKWMIVTPNTFVHKEPSFKSERIEKLPYGTYVVIESLQSGWAKISAPHEGYVRAGDARPAVPQPQ